MLSAKHVSDKFVRVLRVCTVTSLDVGTNMMLENRIISLESISQNRKMQNRHGSNIVGEPASIKEKCLDLRLRQLLQSCQDFSLAWLLNC